MPRMEPRTAGGDSADKQSVSCVLVGAMLVHYLSVDQRSAVEHSEVQLVICQLVCGETTFC